MKKVCVEMYQFGAMYELLVARNLIPYVSVFCNMQLAEGRILSVPLEYVDANGVLTLNISYEATEGLTFDKENGYLMFSARFRGIPQSLVLPVEALSLLRGKDDTMAFHLPSTATFYPVIGYVDPEPPAPKKPEKKTPSFLKVVR